MDAENFQIGPTSPIKHTSNEKPIWDGVRLNWQKPIFAGLTAVTLVAFFEYSRFSVKNTALFLIGGIGTFLNILIVLLLVRDEEKKRSQILNLMMIDILAVVLFGVLGLTLAKIGHWTGIHVLHIWKAILFMSAIAQLSLPVLTVTNEDIDWFTSENHILLGSAFMALASSIYLVLSGQAWYLAFFAFLVASLGTCVACLLWQIREYLIARTRNIIQDFHEVPKVLSIESLGLLISVVVGCKPY